MRSRVRSLAILLLLLTGCQSAMQSVRARYSAEFECPGESVVVTDLTNRAYRARGCGSQATYVSSCDGFGCFGAIIVRDD